MSDTLKVETLLVEANKIIFEYNEIRKKKGESFNIFSILDMERNENKTHSRFLCELLNPKGSHLKENSFLNIFLEIIEYKDIDFSNATVKANHHIGKVDYGEKTGGFIDIYIENNGNPKKAITIENKIFAGDQECQIERYCKHNKEHNKVYYLTLSGAEPAIHSKGKLISGEHFHIISYKYHIIKWLERCIEKCSDNDSILKETIRQYIILIKKLTSTMEKDEKTKILKLVLENFETSKKISEGLNIFLHDFNNEFRGKLFEALNSPLNKEKYVITNDPDVVNRYDRKILIKIKGFSEDAFYFGIANFSTLNPLADTMVIWIGIFNHRMNGSFFKSTPYSIEGTVKNNNAWVNTCNLPDYNDGEKNWMVSLQDENLVSRLISDSVSYEGIIKHLVTECEKYCNHYFEYMKTALKDIPNN